MKIKLHTPRQTNERNPLLAAQQVCVTNWRESIEVPNPLPQPLVVRPPCFRMRANTVLQMSEEGKAGSTFGRSPTPRGVAVFLMTEMFAE